MRLLDKLLAYTPKQVFLADAIGALLTGVLTVTVVAQFPYVFGLPKAYCYCLAITAFVFAVFSLLSAITATRHWRLKIRIIALANLMYASALICLVLLWQDKMRSIGKIYFFLEASILIALAFIELWYARKKQNFPD